MLRETEEESEHVVRATATAFLATVVGERVESRRVVDKSGEKSYEPKIYPGFDPNSFSWKILSRLISTAVCMT